MKENALFRGIPNEYFDSLLKNLNARKVFFKKGMTVLSNLSLNGDIGIVISGECLLIRNDYYGNTSALESYKHNSLFGNYFSKYKSEELSVIALKDSTILFVEYDTIIRNNIKYKDVLIYNLLHVLEEKLNFCNIRLDILSQKTIREKLLEYFHFLEKEQANSTIMIPFSYSTLSNYLATDRSAMMRELKSLKDDGILAIDKRKITLIYR